MADIHLKIYIKDILNHMEIYLLFSKPTFSFYLKKDLNGQFHRKY